MKRCSTYEHEYKSPHVMCEEAPSQAAVLTLHLLTTTA